MEKSNRNWIISLKSKFVMAIMEEIEKTIINEDITLRIIDIKKPNKYLIYFNKSPLIVIYCIIILSGYNL